MNKLTQQEAQDLIQKAWKLVSNRYLGSYRFGQALYNLLPESLYDEFKGSSKDFYDWQDHKKVTEVFYKYFVENINE